MNEMDGSYCDACPDPDAALYFRSCQSRSCPLILSADGPVTPCSEAKERSRTILALDLSRRTYLCNNRRLRTHSYSLRSALHI